MVRCPLIQTPAWTGSTPYPPRLETASVVHTSPVITSTQNATTTLGGTAVLPSNSRSIRHKGSVWEKDEDPSMFEAVVEKGSKQLRAKRLKEMKVSLLPSEERVLGETGDDLEEIFSHSTPKTGKKPSKEKAQPSVLLTSEPRAERIYAANSQTSHSNPEREWLMLIRRLRKPVPKGRCMRGRNLPHLICQKNRPKEGIGQAHIVQQRAAEL